MCLTCMFSTPLLAAPSINDMQSCQGVLDFVESQLDSVGSKYSSDDISTIREGVMAYDDYIQKTIVTPGLLEFNGGDSGKAAAMQKQVDAYKLTLVNGFKAKYPENRLYTDQAVAINNCAQKAVPSGDDLESLKAALNKIVELAKLN